MATNSHHNARGAAFQDIFGRPNPPQHPHPHASPQNNAASAQGPGQYEYSSYYYAQNGAANNAQPGSTGSNGVPSGMTPAQYTAMIAKRSFPTSSNDHHQHQHQHQQQQQQRYYSQGPVPSTSQPSQYPSTTASPNPNSLANSASSSSSSRPYTYPSPPSQGQQQHYPYQYQQAAAPGQQQQYYASSADSYSTTTSPDPASPSHQQRDFLHQQQQQLKRAPSSSQFSVRPQSQGPYQSPQSYHGQWQQQQQQQSSSPYQASPQMPDRHSPSSYSTSSSPHHNNPSSSDLQHRASYAPTFASSSSSTNTTAATSVVNNAFYSASSSSSTNNNNNTSARSSPSSPSQPPTVSLPPLYQGTFFEEADGFDPSGPRVSSYSQYYDQFGSGGRLPNDSHSRRNSNESEQANLYRGNSGAGYSSADARPLLPLNPSLISVATPSSFRSTIDLPPPLPTIAGSGSGSSATVTNGGGGRHSSAPPGGGPNRSASSALLVPARSQFVYPALLSRVAEAFKARIVIQERVKDGLVYSEAFDGRDAVDKIAYIIKTTDRNLALLLGRALDAQKFFHDVTYDHRLRDSAFELYQFKERLAAPFLSTENLTPTDDYPGQTRRLSISDTIASDDASAPSGVFTLLTDCYSPTCTRDRLCYSIACPRRLEQQARLNLKPKPGLQRSMSSESLGDDFREPGSLWIHSVPQEVADSTSEMEKKRQECINEVFYTERDFVRDMEYLRDSWIKPLRSTNIIPENRREDFVTQVFWNVLEILAVNVRLADLLNKRQKQAHVVEKIGDILLDLVPHFAPFVKYGAHQLYGKYEFEKEKSSNPAFAKFVEDTERLPESRKLELNGYLTKPTTRLARYPLLLEAVLKYTADDNPDKVLLPKVVALVREFLKKVNVETGRSENRFNLAQLDQQLVFKNGETVDLRLTAEEREMIFKGPLKKRGGTQSESAELQVFLFDHAVLMVKQKQKNEQYKVYRKPIPLELLIVTPIDDATVARTGVVRPKSLMSRGSSRTYLNNPPPGVDKNSKNGFALHFQQLGRRGYSITLWAATWTGRKKWVEKIEARQTELRERSLVFDTFPLSSGYFVGTNRVTCAAPFENGNRMVYGTDNGVYLADLRETNKVPVKVISVPNVTQLDVLEEQGILIVLADKAVQTFYVDNLDPGDAIGAAKRARKISSHATFFKAGQCLGRTLVCVVKSGSVSSTIKTLEPIESGRGKKQPAIRKFLQGSNEALRVFKEFYIPTESSSVHFLKSKLCVGCTKGFEIVDLETLDTQGLLDPADSSLDFVQKRENARPIAIYRVDGDFLLCYDEFAFYVNKNGWRAKGSWIITWEGFPTSFALHYPYIAAIEPTFIEVRHVETGELLQIIPGANLKCLFADSPPSTSSSGAGGSYFAHQQHGGYGQMPRMPSTQGRTEIIISDTDRVYSLQAN